MNLHAYSLFFKKHEDFVPLAKGKPTSLHSDLLNMNFVVTLLNH